ncbi:MAG: VWA domain-containing protein [Acidobacteriota bacterium]|nr:VWA domain-containing protein [Acidobacteriota bacterium]
MKALRRNAPRLAVICVSTIAVVFAGSQAHTAQRRTVAPAPSSYQTETRGNERVVINTDLITLTVSVTGADGRAVWGLDKSAFTVTDDNVPQEISFFSDADAPVSVGIVFDVSGSMSGDKIMRAREALARFIETSHDRDEYFLVDFNSRARLLLDKTRDSDAVLNKFTYVEPRGNTALYDAAYLGIEKVMHGAHTKRAILLISDGEDNNSRYTFKELRRRLQESGVVVYFIGIGVNYLPRATGAETLKKLATVSGGKAFFPDSTGEMIEAFERIALELRHQYSIGYRPWNFAADGKWHRLKVKIQPPQGAPRLSVRSREGYYAMTR